MLHPRPPALASAEIYLKPLRGVVFIEIGVTSGPTVDVTGLSILSRFTRGGAAMTIERVLWNL
jgi:hypothetical protein